MMVAISEVYCGIYVMHRLGWILTELGPMLDACLSFMDRAVRVNRQDCRLYVGRIL